MQIDKDNWSRVIDGYYSDKEYFIEVVDHRYTYERAVIVLTKEEALAFADAIITEIHNGA